MAHPFCPNPACRQSSTAAPRRTPLRCALGHTGRILGRVASCACSQTLFLPKPSTGTAQTSTGRRALLRRAATTLDLPAPGLSEPQQPHRKFTRATSSLPGQAAPRFELWNANFAFSGAAPPREHAAGAFRRRSRPFSLGPLDQRPTPTIRTGLDQIWTTRSRSSGRESCIPVRPVLFAKEPLPFVNINP